MSSALGLLAMGLFLGNIVCLTAEERVFPALNDVFCETDLEAPQLERKMRLLTLADLGFSRIGQNLSYAEIAAALEIEEREVERWGFDGASS